MLANLRNSGQAFLYINDFVLIVFDFLVAIFAKLIYHRLAPADMAELVDALVSGTSGSNALEVQVLLSAPQFWGCSSVDRALRSHRRGRGFESHQLHQIFVRLNCTGIWRNGRR